MAEKTGRVPLNEKLLLTQAEAREYLSLKKVHWYHLRSAGVLPDPIAAGSVLLWRRADLDEWAERQPTTDRGGKRGGHRDGDDT